MIGIIKSIERTVLLLVGALVSACHGVGADLPPVQASSAHFRYHARSPGDVESDILSRLERNRTEFHQFMGFSDESVIDYYYFADPDDLARNGPCTLSEDGCSFGRAAFASIPFHEHELIHAYMHSVGFPSAPLLEGMANAVGCLRDAVAYEPAEPDWRRAVREFPTSDLTLYAGDHLFVTALIKAQGIAKTLDYYRRDPFTFDPGLFALDFAAVWNVRLDDTWSAAISAGAAGSSLPICPCALDAITVGSPPTSVNHPNAADYRPLASDAGPLTIDFSGNGHMTLHDCRREAPAARILGMSGGQSTIVLQPAAEPDYLSFDDPGVEEGLTASRDLSLQPACSGLSTFAAVTRATQLGVAAPRAGGGSWYLAISTPGLVTAQRRDPGSGAVALCTDCSLTNCQPLLQFTPVSGVMDGSVLQFTPDSALSTKGLDAASIAFY